MPSTLLFLHLQIVPITFYIQELIPAVLSHVFDAEYPTAHLCEVTTGHTARRISKSIRSF